MPIILPTIDPESVTCQLGSSKVIQKGLWGGVERRYQRPGARHSLGIKFPPLTKEQARPLIAALLEADSKGETVRFTFPQVGAFPARAATVNGGNQTGRLLNISSASPLIEADRAFSMIVNGKSYLYITTKDINLAGGDGQLELDCMIRRSPLNATALELNNPVIEGYAGQNVSWAMDCAITTGLDFMLTETR